MCLAVAAAAAAVVVVAVAVAAAIVVVVNSSSLVNCGHILDGYGDKMYTLVHILL